MKSLKEEIKNTKTQLEIQGYFSAELTPLIKKNDSTYSTTVKLNNKINVIEITHNTKFLERNILYIKPNEVNKTIKSTLQKFQIY